MKNILLIGRMASGKSTIAKYLNAEGYVRFSCADWLKTTLDIHYGLDKYNKTDKFIINGVEYTKRTLYQVFGKEIIRSFDNEWHLDELISNINFNKELWTGYKYKNHKFVVDDVRFPNEIIKLKEKFDCITIKLECPENIRIARLIARDSGYCENDFNHVSETNVDLLECDYVIDSSVSEKDIIKIVKQIIKKEK